MMKPQVKRTLFGGAIGVVALFAVSTALSWNTVQRVMLGGVKVHETTPPDLPADLKRPAVLVFSKTNGFRHEEAIPAANAMFAEIARSRGWGYFQTENGGAFTPATLARFDAVVFNNVSGDVFTPDQRRAFESFVENGGGFVGVHGSGGDMKYDWRWYVDHLIGAQFIGHPMNPQFQPADVHVEDRTHPATAHLPQVWRRTDEWYSFKASPRREGVHILATLNEATYSPKGMFAQELAMGEDHPIAWWRCVGKGRVLYSALGHTAQSYAEPEYRQMMAGAVAWALAQEGRGCGSGPGAGSSSPN